MTRDVKLFLVAMKISESVKISSDSFHSGLSLAWSPRGIRVDFLFTFLNCPDHHQRSARNLITVYFIISKHKSGKRGEMALSGLSINTSHKNSLRLWENVELLTSWLTARWNVNHFFSTWTAEIIFLGINCHEGVVNNRWWKVNFA